MTLALALAFGEQPFPTETEPWCQPADLADCAAPGHVDVATVCQVASAVLRNFSGRRYGVRHMTVRPHRLIDSIVLPGMAPTPTGTILTAAGGWFGQGWGWMEGRGLLLDAPANVLEVVVDGATLDPSAYQLFDGRLLVRGGGLDWPYDQDLSRPTTGPGSPGTWSVTYESGTPVPTEAKVAAATLACQLLKLMVGAPDCAIPDRVTALTRQGVSLTILDPNQFFKEGRTGITLVDMWLASLDAARKKRRASIAGPESYRGARQ